MGDQDFLRDPEVDWQPMAPAFVTWARLSGIAPSVVAVVLGVVVVVVPAPAVVRVVLLAGLATSLALVVWLVAWWAPRWTAAWGYAERENDLVIIHGRLVRRLTVVPYGRMQVVEVASDPVLAKLGLARVKLVTASASTDASLPGLTAADAQALRDRLASRGESQAAGL